MNVEHKRDTEPPCKSNAHVCRTLMQYKDGEEDNFIVDEGKNCACDNCSTTWSEHDRYSFTWQHFKRLDMIVQYKLCGPIMPERICNDDEVAALMETEVNGWHIHMREERCRCKNNIFYLRGWEKRNNLWIYEYRCKKVVCATDGAVCAKVYVNRALGEALKYQFTCLCQNSRQCVTEVDIVPNMYTDDDEHGEYVPRMCDQIIGKGR
ncbi:Hypothetical predicted protein [Octopus vulgaris]|uniref:Uncharacterized protein n=2 Tax=Octopus TaxID=6643 RepID=A0AA36EZN0_OCTVU|nr:Hypothetical predicted protein [Octopus vulgaris]